MLDPPIGLVPLRDAANSVGRKMHGKAWRSVNKISWHSIVGKSNSKIESVITRIAEWCESGELPAAYRSETGGADELSRGVWQSASWRMYFADGTIDLDLPLLGDNGRPNKNGLMARGVTREVFVNREMLDRLTAALSGRQTARASPRQIGEFVSNYRRSLQEGNPSIPKCEEFARDNGWSGAGRNALRAEYLRQFPNQRVGRPKK